GARIEIIERIAPWTTSALRRKLANFKGNDGEFAHEVAKEAMFAGQWLHPGSVEAKACDLNLEDYIWPTPACYKDYVLVTDDELAKRRRKEADRKRKEYALKHADHN